MYFHNILINWYLKNKRDLPWRKTKSPYHVWISEIILQQTRVAQGLPYFLSFIEEFPTVKHLANAPESTVLKLWQGLGYYSRARNLHFTAKHIVENLNNTFPDNFEDLKKLKGIGDYTASAIASICYKEATAVVDGNVYRVLSRYFGIHTPINTSKGIKEFKVLAQSLIDKNQPDTYNQAIMDFGSIQCKPKNPDCNVCPFNNSCVAFEKKTVTVLPIKEKKIKVRKRYFNFIIILTNNKVVLQERVDKGIWQNLYQFPLIESEKPIDESELVNSEEFDKWFTNDVNLKLFNTKDIVHKLSHQHLHTKFWIVETAAVNLKTISWDSVNKYPVPILIANFLDNFKKTDH